MHVAVRFFALFALLLCAGCKLVDEQPKNRSPLVPLAAAPDVVTLEIFSAPAALDDPNLSALWPHVNEQPIPPELRKKLAENGLRMGVIGGNVPNALAALLKVTGTPISAEERSLVPMETEPGVVLRMLQPRPGKRHELVVSPVHPRIALLQSVGGLAEGKTYEQAEGRMVLRVFPEEAGRARLELTPELQHGELKTQTTGSDGMFIWRPEREKRVFAELKVESTLAPGEMLIMSCLSERASTVGYHFFMQPKAEKPTQRLWVIRLAQAGPDRAFADWAAAENPPHGAAAGDVVAAYAADAAARPENEAAAEPEGR
jgi:hypothetical protein